MTTTITSPKAHIPIGRVTVGGVEYDVPQHPEFVRFFFDLFRRAGSTEALTNTDLQTLIEHLDSEALMPKTDPVAQQATQAIDELRNELSSIRSEYSTLRARLEQLEDRFT